MATGSISISKTPVFIYSFASLPEALKTTDRLYLDPATNVLARWDGSAMQPIVANVFYATSFESLPTTASTGSLGVVNSSGDVILYAYTGSSWIEIGGGGGGSITLVASEENLPEDAKAGNIAITTDTNILYYYSGSDWVSTQEKITLSAAASITVGGINEGTSVTDMTNQELWEMLLVKELFPALTNPSSNFTFNAGSNNVLKEIGSAIAPLTFTATFNRGSINPQYQSDSQYRSGLPNSYTYTGTGLPGEAVSSTNLTDTQTVASYTVLAGAQSWTMNVSYDAGVQPKSNKGNNYQTPLASGSIGAKSLTINGVYPVYANTQDGDISTMTKQSLASNNSTLTYTMAGETATEKWSVEVPATWNAITGFQVADVGASNWNYMGGGKAESLLQWQTSDINKDVNSTATQVAYKKYTFNGALQGVSQLRVQFN